MAQILIVTIYENTKYNHHGVESNYYERYFEHAGSSKVFCKGLAEMGWLENGGWHLEIGVFFGIGIGILHQKAFPKKKSIASDNIKVIKIIADEILKNSKVFFRNIT